MKKYLLILTLFIGILSFDNKMQAQSFNINVNISNQPAWGPTGYDYVEYYYFPEINCYYNVVNQQFFYQNRGRWTSDRYLPYSYRNSDLYSLYKVVINVNQPWLYNNSHRRDYKKYVGRHNQVVIRDSRDQRYRMSRKNTYAWYSPNYRPIPRPSNNSNYRPTPPHRNEMRPSRPSNNNLHNRPRPNDNRVTSNNNSRPNRENRPNVSDNRNNKNNRNKQQYNNSSKAERNHTQRERR